MHRLRSGVRRGGPGRERQSREANGARSSTRVEAIFNQLTCHIWICPVIVPAISRVASPTPEKSTAVTWPLAVKVAVSSPSDVV